MEDPGYGVLDAVLPRRAESQFHCFPESQTSQVFMLVSTNIIGKNLKMIITYQYCQIDRFSLLLNF